MRLCIRDSLLRLAKSAVERTNAREWSSTNKSSREEKEGSIEECNIMSERSMKLPTETGTNPIDRIVAHLLFHWPSEQTSRIVKEEVMQSPSFPGESLGAWFLFFSLTYYWAFCLNFLLLSHTYH